MVTGLPVKTNGVKVAQSCPTLCDPPWTVARQAPLSLRSSRQEYWSGLLCLPPEDLSDPGISIASPALAGKCCKIHDHFYLIFAFYLTYFHKYEFVEIPKIVTKTMS